MSVAGNTIRQVWFYMDLNEAPLTGMVSPADVTLALKVDIGAGTVTAGEVVTWVEQGLGYYDVVFTPVGTGLYTLFLKELNANSFQRRFQFTFSVQSAGAVFAPAYANSFCAETDIERWTQTGIDTASNPNDTEAAGFAQNRAAILMALCAGWGYSVTPSSVPTDSRIKNLLREANAIGAALDYTLAQQFRLSPSLSDRPALLQQMWVQYAGGRAGEFATPIVGYLQIEIQQNLVSLATDHILSGDTQARPVSTPPTDSGIQVGMGDVY